MAEHYEEHSDKMRDVVNRYRTMLPDSTRLNIEFGEDKSDVFSKQVMKELERAVTDSCGCIGIYISGYPDEEYSILKFRRINMGMFEYHLYDKALSQAQIDSLKAHSELIVYNDSTVFYYGSGAFGDDFFPDRQEFLKELRNRNH